MQPALDELRFRQFLDNLDTIEPRAYQEEIRSIASERNTLVILPTALGKTIIAITVAIDRLKRYPWGKVVVLAPTRPLVDQHRETFTRFLEVDGAGKEFFKACQFDGKVSPARRAEMFNASNLIFSTPQTMKNDLGSQLYSLADCVLLVIDECHKTGKRYAYNHVAQEYMLACPDPILLALTASPGREEGVIQELCTRLFIEQLTIRSRGDEDVKPYIHDITQQVIELEPTITMLEMQHLLDKTISEHVDELQAMGFLSNKERWRVHKMDILRLGHELWRLAAQQRVEPADTVETRGNGIPAENMVEKETGYCSEANPGLNTRAETFRAIGLQTRCMKLMHLRELITTQSYYSAIRFIDKMREKGGPSNVILLSDRRVAEVENMLRENLENGEFHPKVKHFLGLLAGVIGTQSETRGAGDCNRDAKVIVFTQFRDTVTWLVELIDRLNDPGFLARFSNDLPSCGGTATREKTFTSRPRFRPVQFIGQPANGRDSGLTQQEQREILASFRHGDYNVLVATRIAEEGLDIPSVDDIICFEPVPSEIRFIQRRGRTGRHAPGRLHVLVTGDTLDEVFHSVSQFRYRKMKELIRAMNGIPIQEIPRESMEWGKPMSDELLAKRAMMVHELSSLGIPCMLREVPIPDPITREILPDPLARDGNGLNHGTAPFPGSMAREVPDSGCGPEENKVIAASAIKTTSIASTNITVGTNRTISTTKSLTKTTRTSAKTKMKGHGSSSENGPGQERGAGIPRERATMEPPPVDYWSVITRVQEVPTSFPGKIVGFVRSNTNFHALLKKLQGRDTMKKQYKLKRTRKVHTSESGTRFYDKTSKWIYNQLKELGKEEDGMLVLDFKELEEMASFEEIDPDEFSYRVKYGAKKSYWQVEGEQIKMAADF